MKKLLVLTIIILLEITASAAVKPAVEVFLERYTHLVANKRVGLLTNLTGTDSKGNSVIDVLKKDPRINLVALFAPEHGVRGEIKAGQTFKDHRDVQSGIMVYSAYADGRKRPSLKDLKKVDILIFNLQDLGCKTFTFIWSMTECMAAAAEAKIPMIIFDVPNLMGLEKSDGFMREEKFKSFIGLHPTPYTYALTMGEMARYIKHTQNINCKLLIIPMHNYRRSMKFSETKLPWTPLSPNIQTLNSAYGYLISGPIGMLGIINSGIKHQFPFQVIAAPYLNGEKMAKHLNSLKLGGVYFRPISYKCVYGRFKNEMVYGIKMDFYQVQKLRPVRVIIAILCYLRDYVPQFEWNRTSEIYQTGFDQALGTSKVRLMLENGKSLSQIVNAYQQSANNFDRECSPYKIYK